MAISTGSSSPSHGKNGGETMNVSTEDVIDDIEDIVGGGGRNGEERQRDLILPKLRAKFNSSLSAAADSHRRDATADASFVPGSSKIYVKTWGCAHNSSDAEYMSGQLADAGYPLTENKEDADLWLLNSCTVKSPSEDHFRNAVLRGLDAGKKVVVAGCVPQGKPGAEYIAGLSVVGVQQIDRVVDVVEETLKGNSVRFLGQKKAAGGKKTGGASLSLPKVRRNPLIEIIAINTGCLNQCTYCKTKHARGELGSYPIDEIVARAEQSFGEGVVELWLTSEDLGAYGRDIGVTLPELLWRLVEVIPEGCRLRLGMTNPPYIMDHLDDMAKILKHPRVYSFLHVPVQSGSDSVLRDMKREYNSDDFSRVVNILRKKVPGITIATDIIAGFPTETEEDFRETMILCKKYKFASLFINQFFPRPGTPAAKMKRVPTQEVKRRTRQLSEFFHSYRPFADRMGARYEVLVTETAHDGEHYVGHNCFYEQVLLPKDPDLMGKLVHVEIVDMCKFSMTGKVVEAVDPVSPTDVVPLGPGEVSGAAKKQKEEDKKTSVIYHGSVIILGLAILVRLLQLFLIAFNNKRGSSVVGSNQDQQQQQGVSE